MEAGEDDGDGLTYRIRIHSPKWFEDIFRFLGAVLSGGDTDGTRYEVVARFRDGPERVVHSERSRYDAEMTLRRLQE